MDNFPSVAQHAALEDFILQIHPEDFPLPVPEMLKEVTEVGREYLACVCGCTSLKVAKAHNACPAPGQSSSEPFQKAIPNMSMQPTLDRSIPAVL